MLFAEGAHGIDGLASSSLFFLAQRRIFPSDGFEGAFDDLFGRAAEAVSEGRLNDLAAVGRG